MISLRQERPRTGRLRYSYLCLTSHFGCGHLEVAFYEIDRQVTFYAVRNMARSSATRIGWHGVAQRLGPTGEGASVLRALTERIERAGMAARVAPVAECVELALDRRLVHPRSHNSAAAAIERRSRRLSVPPSRRELLDSSGRLGA